MSALGIAVDDGEATQSPPRTRVVVTTLNEVARCCNGGVLERGHAAAEVRENLADEAEGTAGFRGATDSAAMGNGTRPGAGNDLADTDTEDEDSSFAVRARPEGVRGPEPRRPASYAGAAVARLRECDGIGGLPARAGPTASRIASATRIPTARERRVAFEDAVARGVAGAARAAREGRDTWLGGTLDALVQARAPDPAMLVPMLVPEGRMLTSWDTFLEPGRDSGAELRAWLSAVHGHLSVLPLRAIDLGAMWADRGPGPASAAAPLTTVDLAGMIFGSAGSDKERPPDQLALAHALLSSRTDVAWPDLRTRGYRQIPSGRVRDFEDRTAASLVRVRALHGAHPAAGAAGAAGAASATRSAVSVHPLERPEAAPTTLAPLTSSPADPPWCSPGTRRSLRRMDALTRVLDDEPGEDRVHAVWGREADGKAQHRAGLVARAASWALGSQVAPRRTDFDLLARLRAVLSAAGWDDDTEAGYARGGKVYFAKINDDMSLAKPFPKAAMEEEELVRATIRRAVAAVNTIDVPEPAAPMSASNRSEAPVIADNSDFDAAYDLRGIVAVSVDRKGNAARDDAFSIEPVNLAPPGAPPVIAQRLWLHVSDVGRWVHRGSALADEAMRRLTTRRDPGHPPRHMFPPRLVRAMSLSKTHPSFAYSVGFIVRDGKVHKSTVRRTVIAPVHVVDARVADDIVAGAFLAATVDAADGPGSRGAPRAGHATAADTEPGPVAELLRKLTRIYFNHSHSGRFRDKAMHIITTGARPSLAAGSASSVSLALLAEVVGSASLAVDLLTKSLPSAKGRGIPNALCRRYKIAGKGGLRGEVPDGLPYLSSPLVRFADLVTHWVFGEKGFGVPLAPASSSPPSSPPSSSSSSSSSPSHGRRRERSVRSTRSAVGDGFASPGSEGGGGGVGGSGGGTGGSDGSGNDLDVDDGTVDDGPMASSASSPTVAHLEDLAKQASLGMWNYEHGTAHPRRARHAGAGARRRRGDGGSRNDGFGSAIASHPVLRLNDRIAFAGAASGPSSSSSVLAAVTTGQTPAASGGSGSGTSGGGEDTILVVDGVHLPTREMDTAGKSEIVVDVEVSTPPTRGVARLSDFSISAKSNNA